MTHDYKRHGTTTLFAALEVATGKVVSETCRKHRHQELLSFLRKVEGGVPKGKDIHIIMDNYGTHKHRKVREWAEKKKRVHFHFIPTSSSWLNLVERFFAELTMKRIRRGMFRSVAQLEKRLKEWIDKYQAYSAPPPPVPTSVIVSPSGAASRGALPRTRRPQRRHRPAARPHQRLVGGARRAHPGPAVPASARLHEPRDPPCANLAATRHPAELALAIGGETASDPNGSARATVPKN